TWRGAGRNIEAQRNTLLIAGLQAHRLAAGDDLGQSEGPTAFAGDGLARVVHDDELFLEGFAGKEIVVLAGDLPGLAADIGQQRNVHALHTDPFARRSLLPKTLCPDPTPP